jgi:DNA-binding IclR family transcriptional regulator
MPRKKGLKGESRQKVLNTLKEAQGPLTPRQIAAKTRLNRNSVRRLAQELFKEGAVSKPKRGLYQAK